LLLRTVWRPSKKYEARAAVVTESQELAEVGVGSNHYPAVSPSDLHDLLVKSAAEPEVSDVDGIMAAIPGPKGLREPTATRR
jgi:hypothetical protein